MRDVCKNLGSGQQQGGERISRNAGQFPAKTQKPNSLLDM